ncbi:uncharacterized protein LOC134341175 isoform X1 [Mobula hypostoma]|uniref:uncharacterized protein LOC134341175 isoform X1 n=1 Tax=Mobula hypostoma TaxID=723540 RepID=UPI002FC39CE7
MEQWKSSSSHDRTSTWPLFGGVFRNYRPWPMILVCGGLVVFYLCRKHGISFRQIARLNLYRSCIRLIKYCYRYFVPQTVHCQVECYGQGEIHHEIVKKLNITEEPGAPLILFVYKVSRETEDLRNALQWIEGNTGREKEDICAVILLEKCLGKQNLSMAVAHQGVFGTNSVVVRIFWEQQRNSSGKILKDSSNKTAMAKVREKIMERQGSPAGGGH